jgi:hypothetical protein
VNHEDLEEELIKQAMALSLAESDASKKEA